MVWCPPPPGGSILSPPRGGGLFQKPSPGPGQGRGPTAPHPPLPDTGAPPGHQRRRPTPPEPRMPRPAHLPPRLQMRRQLPWVGWALGSAQVSRAPVPRAGLPSSSCPPGTPSPQPRPPQRPRVSSTGRALPPSQLIPRKGLQDPQGRGIPRQHHLSPTAQVTLTGPHSQDQGQEGCRLTACASTPPSPGPRPGCGSGHPRQETRRPGPEPLGAPGAQRAGSPHPRPATRESSPAWHLSPSKPPAQAAGCHTLSSMDGLSPQLPGKLLDTRFAAAVAGGAELFLHSEGSPSRPGEQVPADGGHHAVPRHRHIRRSWTAAARHHPPTRCHGAGAGLAHRVSPRPCAPVPPAGHQTTDSQRKPENRCQGGGTPHSGGAQAGRVSHAACSWGRFPRAALSGSSRGHERPVWTKGEERWTLLAQQRGDRWRTGVPRHSPPEPSWAAPKLPGKPRRWDHYDQSLPGENEAQGRGLSRSRRGRWWPESQVRLPRRGSLLDANRGLFAGRWLCHRAGRGPRPQPKAHRLRGTWGGGVGGRDAVGEQRCAPPPTVTVQQTALGSPCPFLLPQDGASLQASHQRRPTAPLAAAACTSPGPGRPTLLAVLGNLPPRAPHITCCTGQKNGPPRPQPAPPPASPRSPPDVTWPHHCRVQGGCVERAGLGPGLRAATAIPLPAGAPEAYTFQAGWAWEAGQAAPRPVSPPASPHLLAPWVTGPGRGDSGHHRSWPRPSGSICPKPHGS